MNLLQKIKIYLRNRGKYSFISKLDFNARILDVGCGNRSPEAILLLRPDLKYTGIDIEKINHLSSVNYETLVARPEKFHIAIESIDGLFDAIISSHNLEHCNYPEQVMKSMLTKLKPLGMIYISFPSEHTVDLPSRRGTLNFYDDNSHKLPINLVKFMNDLNETSEIVFYTKKYKPKFLWLIGGVFEPLAKLFNFNLPFGATWAYYGFETIIWAKKR